jgi:hypothetical protein
MAWPTKQVSRELPHYLQIRHERFFKTHVYLYSRIQHQTRSELIQRYLGANQIITNKRSDYTVNRFMKAISPGSQDFTSWNSENSAS